jgi:hypothetical protein
MAGRRLNPNLVKMHWSYTQASSPSAGRAQKHDPQLAQEG